MFRYFQTVNILGDWNIAILYDGQHIQGSPFDVRVYDASRVRVMDPLGGAVGKMFAFTGREQSDNYR